MFVARQHFASLESSRQDAVAIAEEQDLARNWKTRDTNPLAAPKGAVTDSGRQTSAPAKALPPELLYRSVDESALRFRTTVELEPIQGMFGQTRAKEAIDFGTQIGRAGFNLFAIGPSGSRMREALKSTLEAVAAGRDAPQDWIYVHNFQDHTKPVAIAMPPSRAFEFRDAMRDLVEDLNLALPAAFESEDYQSRRSRLDEAFQKRQEEAFDELRKKALARSITILRTPLGFGLAPARDDGSVIPPQEFNAWPEEKKRELQTAMKELEKDLEQTVRQIPIWEKEHRQEVRALDRETARFAVGHSIDELKARFSDIARIVEYLETVRDDLIQNVGLFSAREEAAVGIAVADGRFDRYEVNVLVTQEQAGKGAPVIEEAHPSLGNLLGRVEYLSHQGALVTNFRLIKPGALHRANGGFLLMDARSLLMEPFSWTALKHSLRRGKIVIEDFARYAGLGGTVTLEPDPVPLDVKIILHGDRLLYHLLSILDPDTPEFFKVLADFEDDVERSAENEMLFARLIAAFARRDEMKPIDRGGVARLIEHAARSSQHAGKLTLEVDEIRDVLAEAEFLAGEARRELVAREDVDQAIARRIRRSTRILDRMQESIAEGVALIDTEGARIGQVNGLSLSEFGGVRFGRPSRITCRTRPGSGKLVDIEREVELGGPIHSKGVLILNGFLAGRYALEAPMSLYASLVFEQSYGGVEGDSASSAELYALLSSLAEVPVRQDLAVTGSVNQHGDIQAIGGVNEKIEGFFDICQQRGLSGSQGVLIPQANVPHLMLRRDVVEACADGRFAIYPVDHIDQGLELLTGISAGRRGLDKKYPEGSVGRKIEDRLIEFARVRQRFETEDEASSSSGSKP